MTSFVYQIRQPLIGKKTTKLGYPQNPLQSDISDPNSRLEKIVVFAYLKTLFKLNPLNNDRVYLQTTE